MLSDRAQVFLTAALQIWNNETMKEFLDRAYRIVTDDASGEDYEKTNIHACLAHVLIVSCSACCMHSSGCSNKGCPADNQQIRQRIIT